MVKRGQGQGRGRGSDRRASRSRNNSSSSSPAATAPHKRAKKEASPPPPSFSPPPEAASGTSTSTPEAPAVSLIFTEIERVYRDCFFGERDDTNKKDNDRSKIWNQQYQQGVLSKVIWPALVAEYDEEYWKLQHTRSVSPLLFEYACPLVAILVSTAHAPAPADERSHFFPAPEHVLEFALQEDEPEPDQAGDKGLMWWTSFWTTCFTFMCQHVTQQRPPKPQHSGGNDDDGNHNSSSWDGEYVNALIHCLTLMLGECSIHLMDDETKEEEEDTHVNRRAAILRGWIHVVMGNMGTHKNRMMNKLNKTQTQSPEECLPPVLWTRLPPSQAEWLMLLWFRKHQHHQKWLQKAVAIVTTDPNTTHATDDDATTAANTTTAAKATAAVPFISIVIQRVLEVATTSKADLTVQNPSIMMVQQWIFLHKSLQLMLDLLAHPTLRPILVPYVSCLHVHIHLRRALGMPSSSLNHKNQQNSNHYLTQQLIARLEQSVRMGDVVMGGVGRSKRWSLLPQNASPRSLEDLYHTRAITLQKMCHCFFSHALSDLIYAGAGTLTLDPKFVRNALAALNDAQLLDLLTKMRLMDASSCDDVKRAHGRDFLHAVLEDYVLLPTHVDLLSTPLYANEQLLWDLTRIPPSLSILMPPSHVLALPKLSNQFVDFVNYLTTNFELTQASSAYDIRVDLVDVIRRMRPVVRHQQDNNDATSVVQTTTATEFAGWARMAMDVHTKLEITHVFKAAWGGGGSDQSPKRVIAEVTIDLRPCGESIRREWDELGEFDNLFLVAIDASKQSGQTAAPSYFHRDNNRLVLQQGDSIIDDTDMDRKIPDEEDGTFPQRYGVTLVRGCTILHVKDADGNVLNDPSKGAASSNTPSSTKRIFHVELDPAQYHADYHSPSGTDLYKSINLIVRRHGRENNFKAVLETIRGLVDGAGSIEQALPTWLQPVILGHGDPSIAHYKSESMLKFAQDTAGVAKPDDPLDFGDTFLNELHLRSCFSGSNVIVDGREDILEEESGRRMHRLRITESNGGSNVEATSYEFPKAFTGNTIPFTPTQVEAIRSGLSPGLTMIIGPPGTGKTDVACQIISCLYHSFPSQRTIVITHSNAALNDIFQKVMHRGDIDERYLVRLGAGERDLETHSSHDFTKAGRVAYSLQRRSVLLEQVQRLSESLGLSTLADRGEDGSPSYTCQTAVYFHRHHITQRVREFERNVKERLSSTITTTTTSSSSSSASNNVDEENVTDIFPFSKYFDVDTGSTLSGDAATNSTASDVVLTAAASSAAKLPLLKARAYVKQVGAIFDELAEYRPLELLKYSQRQRSDYLIMKQARIVAMTCTHAAIARSQLLELGFQYDNIVVEEAGQMTEIETFIPLLLQERGGGIGGDGGDQQQPQSRLKRVCLMGDPHQLPPVIKNQALAHVCHLDQSMFARLIRLSSGSSGSGVSTSTTCTIQLDMQGRARPEIALLYNWRYRYPHLGNLDRVRTSREYTTANGGFVHTCQVIHVGDYLGKGEQCPTLYFYQNVGEAEYAVALFQYMVLIGYAPSSISILTPYQGQKALLMDICANRCGRNTPLAGVRPGAIATIDQYQGQQNDYIILSLVRTGPTLGHIRDIRRWSVAVSRSRLGLYIVCRSDVLLACAELRPSLDHASHHLCERSPKLQLLLHESVPTNRHPEALVPDDEIFEVDDVTHLGRMVFAMQQQLVDSSRSSNNHTTDTDTDTLASSTATTTATTAAATTTTTTTATSNTTTTEE